jgi:hypothetical protein
MKHADVPFVIDFHTHMLDEELRAICTSRNAITGFGKKQAPPSANLRKFLDPELQIADMDERGIDMHVVFTGRCTCRPGGRTRRRRQSSRVG